MACFCVIICLIFQCIYLPWYLNLNHNLKSEESKSMDVLDRASPSGNLGTNLEELHTLKSISKKPKGDGGNRKKKFEFDKVLCENKA